MARNRRVDNVGEGAEEFVPNTTNSDMVVDRGKRPPFPEDHIPQQNEIVSDRENPGEGLTRNADGDVVPTQTSVPTETDELDKEDSKREEVAEPTTTKTSKSR